MIVVPIFDHDGRRVGEESIDPADFGGAVNVQLLHDVVRMHRANRRVGTVNTRGRSDVAGSGKKLFRQKGTGNARAGSKRTNKRKGGGVAFARRNRDYGYAMPKKAVRLAIRMALLSKFQDGQALVIDDLGLGGVPRTKAVARILKALPRPDSEGRGAGLAGQTVLLGLPGHDPVAYRSARNIAGVMVAPVAEFNTHDVLRQRYLLLTREALAALKGRVGAPVERRAPRPAAAVSVRVEYPHRSLAEGIDVQILRDAVEVRPVRSWVKQRGQWTLAEPIRFEITGPILLCSNAGPPDHVLLTASDIRLPAGLELASDPGTELVRISRPTGLAPEPPTGFHRPSPHVPGGVPAAEAPTTSQVKRPLIWVAGRDVEEEPPLRVGEWHVLHIQMGEPGRPTLVEGGAGDVPIEDIPEAGLWTDWVVSSSYVELEAHPEDGGVGVEFREYPREEAGGPPVRVWSARFALLVRREADSEIRRLRVRPRHAGWGRVDFAVYLRGGDGPASPREPYRWFHVDLPLRSG